MGNPRFSSIDPVVLSRSAYSKGAAYRPERKDDPTAPTASGREKEVLCFADRAQKPVFSWRLRNPLGKNTRIVRGTPAEELARLRSKDGGDIALGEGPWIAQAFLADGLVDERLILGQPSSLGREEPLFRAIDEPDRAEDRIPEGAPGRLDLVVREVR